MGLQTSRLQFVEINVIVMTGFIKLYRQFLEWEWYDDINTKVLFIHMLLKANYEEKSWKGEKIKRGQLVTSIKSLSSEIQQTTQQVRTSLNKLKSTNEITIKATNKYTIINIENYSLYQDKNAEDNKQNNKQITNEQQTNNKQDNKQNNKQITTTKEIKKEELKKEKNTKKEKKDFERKEKQFVEFWDAFKYKKNVNQARLKYFQALDKANHDEIMQAVKKYISSKEREEDQKYWQQAKTWLHNERWNEEYEMSANYKPPPKSEEEILKQVEGKRKNNFTHKQLGVSASEYVNWLAETEIVVNGRVATFIAPSELYKQQLQYGLHTKLHFALKSMRINKLIYELKSNHD